MASGKPEQFECRRPANPENTKFQNIKEHFEDFKNASMEEHKKCLMNTFNKVFSIGSSKPAAEPAPKQVLAGASQQSAPQEVESVLKVRATSL
ncbi:hypothetical protein KFL_004800050 [Klebsormidium nitens]|uniref:Uncharacterized protein n=1 Tax=Klebsormidium nitens TaxID=105231 RepID=A0A1Y1IDM4_KLENI|nr:hypothetical protein KFL_004800050 [Klebsormidium nitens]|eukprot:GAQ89020.1 hypothetical protein KFL_004800050 [Klebsormidium nitens]